MDRTNRQHFVFFLIDLFMISILMVNLMWILLDALFAVPPFQNALRSISPSAVELYMPVHKNFFLYDLGFIVVYVT